VDWIAAPGVGRFLRWRHSRVALQIPLMLVAMLMVWDGLTGPSLAPKNLATVLSWVHYRGWLILVLLMAGNFFCLACPFMLPRSLARRLLRPTRMWPRRLRNKWIAVALFGLLLFAYELLDLWATPWWTAWLIVAYFLGALLVDSLFRGAPFCKYICPIGQFNFTAASVSPLEVRARDRRVCAACRTVDCIRGREGQRGCELWLFQGRKVGNMDCTFCLDCVHACPYENVGIIARLPGGELWADLWRSGVGRLSRRPDLAAMAVIFTFGALLNAFGMVRPIYVVEARLTDWLGVRTEFPVLGVIFVLGLGVGPALLLGAAGWLARQWGGGREPLLWIVTRYAYALIPLGVGMWAAHYSFHLLTGFWSFIPVVQRLLSDLGWPVLGAPRWGLGSVLPMGWLDPVETGLLGLGLVGSLLVAYRIAAGDRPDRPWRMFLPWAALAVLVWGAAVWLMAQPMEMRGMLMAG